MKKKKKKKTYPVEDLNTKTILLIYVQNCKMDTLFMTKSAGKPYPLEPHIPSPYNAPPGKNIPSGEFKRPTQ